MSGPARSGPAGAAPAAGGGADPSMEDILASIRRILSEDEQPHAPPASSLSGPSGGAPGDVPGEVPGEVPGSVLVLDPGMMVPEPAPAPPAPPPAPPEEAVARPAEPPPEPAARAPAAEPPPPAAVAQAAPPTTSPELALDQGPLVDAQTRLAAASSVGNLVRTLSAGRAAQVHRGGPTLEDLAREMMRPLLKEWLDRHLPLLVERLVSAEIEKVVRNSGL